jgi:Transposase DDE domain group 1
MAEGIAQLSLDFHPTLPMTLGFEAPQISSDGGVVLLRPMAERLGLSERRAALLPEEREERKGRHARRAQVRQRLYQLALGYADCHAADRLRQDPLRKSVCKRAPQAGGLSSPPTLSRLENAVDARTVRVVLREIEEQYVRAFPQAPAVILWDLASTDDPTHGQQQLAFFHG